ncbi:MAG: hypothetical protein RR342_03545 [Bacilli bacterium]
MKDYRNEKLESAKRSDEHPFGYYNEDENKTRDLIFMAFEMFESNQRGF